MSNTLMRLAEDYADHDFISFDTDGVGVSRVTDEVWDFTALGQTNKYVRFTAVSDPVHRANVQKYMAAFHEHIKKESMFRDASVAKLFDSSKILIIFVKQCNVSDLALLSDDRAWRNFKTDINGRYSFGTLGQIASAINCFNDAGLCERRFPKSEFSPLANSSAGPALQAIAIPSAMHSKLLQELVSTVETYHTHRYDISKSMVEFMRIWREENERLKSEKGVSVLSESQESLLNNRVRKHARELVGSYNIPNFDVSINGSWVGSLAGKCFMVVGLFSGARMTEILSMTPDSYEVVGGVDILKGTTSKGNLGRPVTKAWVSHPIAFKALELAHEIVQYARDEHTIALDKKYAEKIYSTDKYEGLKKELAKTFITPGLYEHLIENERIGYISTGIRNKIKPEVFDLCASEDDIREFDLLNPSRSGDLILGGTLPKLSPHDLRRSFAVFMVRHRLGNLQSIKRQYGHKNLQMSGWYANNADLARMEDLLLDSELMEVCDEALENAAVDALDEIYNGSAVLSGRQGERISKDKEDALRRGEQMYLSRSELLAFVRGGEKPLVMLPTGAYCTNSSCERLCTIGYFNTDKKPCEHQVITDRSAKIQGKERLNLIESFRGMNELNDYALSSILAGMKQKILYIEQTLKTHTIEFESFTDRINITEVV
jgi:hypothetical protein